MPPKQPKKDNGSEETSAPIKFSIGDKVLGRIKGYPPWPAKIVDPEKEYLTKAVLQSKPGKKSVFLVRYYTDGNYSWSPASELKALTEKAIEAYVGGSKKGGALMNAYKTAQDPDQWEAENAENQDRNRAADDGADQLDDSDDEVETGGKTGGKRKRKSDSKGQNDGDKKKAKTSAKDSKAKGKGADKNGKSKGKDSEDKSEGMLKTKEWRNKLQKAFLQGTLPTSAQAAEFDKVFSDMEAFDHKQEWLVPTKLPKVVKKIAAIKDDIPGDAEYKFKSRSLKLIDQWKDALFGTKEDASEEKKDTEAVAEPNGDAKTDAVETNGDAAAAEPVVEKEGAEDVKMDESKTDEPAKDAPVEDAAAAEPKPAEDADASATQ